MKEQNYKTATAKECNEQILFCEFMTEDGLHDLKDSVAYKRLFDIAMKYEDEQNLKDDKITLAKQLWQRFTREDRDGLPSINNFEQLKRILEIWDRAKKIMKTDSELKQRLFFQLQNI